MHKPYGLLGDQWFPGPLSSLPGACYQVPRSTGYFSRDDKTQERTSRCKGYCEKMSYVRTAKELPFLSDEEIEEVAVQYGFAPADISISSSHDDRGEKPSSSDSSDVEKN